jgi:hypothetical protein
MREARKSPRISLHYAAWIATEDGFNRQCLVADISSSGARIQIDTRLPERLWLVLTNQGNLRRRCRLIWQSDNEAGLCFDKAATGR